MTGDEIDLELLEPGLDENPADDVVLDHRGDIDDTLREVAVEVARLQKAKKQPQYITIRVQPALLRPLAPNGPSYVGWRGLSWSVSVRSFQAGQTLRRALGEFFAAITRVGMAQVERTLKGLEKST